MYIRKTKDVYNLYIDYGQGLEYITQEETRKEANKRKHEYLENDKSFLRIIIKKEREKIILA